MSNRKSFDPKDPKPTPTWTRREFKRLSGMTDAQLDAAITESGEHAASVNRANPIITVGEGDDQLIRVDPVFAKLVGLTD